MLGKSIAFTDLAGTINKFLIVPKQHQGIVTDAKGIQTYPAGSWPVITWRERVLGNIAGMQFALVSAEAQTISLKIAPLPDINGGAYQLNAVINLHVSDAIAFYQQLVLHNGALTNHGLALQLAERLRSQATTLDWVDRLQSRPYSAVDAFKLWLNDEVKNWGLTITDVVDLGVMGLDAFAHKPATANKWNAFLQSQNAQGVMDRIHSITGWEDLLMDMASELSVELNSEKRLRLATQLGSATPEMRERLLRDLPNILLYKQPVSINNEVPLRQRLRVWVPSAEQDSLPQAISKWQWVPSILRISLVCILIAGVGIGVWRVLTADQLQSGLQQLLGVAFITAPLLIIGGGAMFLVQNKIAKDLATASNGQLLALMGDGKRRDVDSLVRQQLKTDMKYVLQGVKAYRKHIFQRLQNESRALDVMQGIEKDVKVTMKKLSYLDLGNAAYLTEAKITQMQFAAMLDHDASLLAQSAHLTNMTKRLQKALMTDRDTTQLEVNIKNALIEFDQQWQARAQFLRSGR